MFKDLFSTGGPVLWAILAGSVLMWTLIIERYWFLRFTLPRERRDTLERWQARPIDDSLTRQRLRDSLTRQLSNRCTQGLESIQVLTAILPLLGLLGTVTGMITIFEVMTLFGTGNSRGMAAGISAALITTMAGLVTALSGIYFANQVEKRAGLAVQQVHRAMA